MEYALGTLLAALLVFGGVVLNRFVSELRRTVQINFNIDLDEVIDKAVRAVEELGFKNMVVNKADDAYKMVIAFARLRGLKITPEMEKDIRNLIVAKVQELGFGQTEKKNVSAFPPGTATITMKQERERP